MIILATNLPTVINHILSADQAKPLRGQNLS